MDRYLGRVIDTRIGPVAFSRNAACAAKEVSVCGIDVSLSAGISDFLLCQYPMRHTVAGRDRDVLPQAWMELLGRPQSSDGLPHSRRTHGRSLFTSRAEESG